MNLVPQHPRRVAVSSSCPPCGGTGWSGGAYGAPCRRCSGTGRNANVHRAFEPADLLAALDRMKLDTSVRRGG